MSNRPEIGPAFSAEWPAAFDLALQYLSEDERPARVANALTLLAAGEIEPRGIFVAREQVELTGVQVCIPLPGASALFWLPQVTARRHKSDLADRLVAAALEWVFGAGAKIGQSLITAGMLDQAGPLLRAGFQHATRLQYLRHTLAGDTAGFNALAAQLGLRLAPWSNSIADVFRETLGRTYEGTLDCPELNGVRTLEETLAGHRAQGVWQPDTWWLAYVSERPAGVLLLTELRDVAAWDLSYVGVVPEYRGHGIGRALTLHALDAAHRHGSGPLLVAVDCRNGPALTLYGNMGFEPTETREVLLYLPPVGASCTDEAPRTLQGL